MAIDRMDPIGPERGDLRAALIAATMANVMRGKGQRAMTLKDFLLDFDREAPPSGETSLEGIKAALTKMAEASQQVFGARGADATAAAPQGTIAPPPAPAAAELPPGRQRRISPASP